MPSAPVLEAPNDFDAFALAEWLETTMMLEERTSINRSDIRARWALGSEPDQAEVDRLFAEIRRRAGTAPAVYPYRSPNSDSITLDADVDSTVYQFLLMLSMEHAPYRTENRYNEVSPALELLTAEALKAQLGPLANALPFGWPSSFGRPKYLGDAARWLANEMGVTVGPIDEDVDEDDKDGGIDVVGWSPFADGATSFLVVLCQCTVQMTYERKPGDVEPRMWMQWLRIGSSALVALSIPMAIPSDAKVRIHLRDRAALVLDRQRLCQLLSHRDLTTVAELDCIRGWVAGELPKVREALVGADKPPQVAPRRRPKKSVKSPVDGTSTANPAARSFDAGHAAQTAAAQQTTVHPDPSPDERSGGTQDSEAAE
jgi:hypothetical protein